MSPHQKTVTWAAPKIASSSKRRATRREGWPRPNCSATPIPNSSEKIVKNLPSKAKRTSALAAASSEVGAGMPPSGIACDGQK
jgi:hypothetical protein